MKQSAAMSLALVLFAAGPVIAYAQSGDMKGMETGGKSSASKGATHKANAVVKALDAKKSTVTLAHGPVPSMNWPAMSMTFKVKDKAMIDKLAVDIDKKIDVEFVQDGKDYVVTSVR